MIAKITPTDEQQRVLQTEQQTPVVMVDSQGNPTHVVLPIGEARRMLDEHLRRELEIVFAQADRGEWVDWNPEQIKSGGRRLLAERAKLTR